MSFCKQRQELLLVNQQQVSGYRTMPLLVAGHPGAHRGMAQDVPRGISVIDRDVGDRVARLRGACFRLGRGQVQCGESRAGAECRCRRLGLPEQCEGLRDAFAAFLAGQAALPAPAPHAALGQPGVLRAVLTAGAYPALIALIGLGLGAVLRHTAGAICAVVAILFLLPRPGDAFRPIVGA
jgi:hypothetical protein